MVILAVLYWLKAFLVEKNSSFWQLSVIQNVTHVTNGDVLSQRVLYGKYSTVIHLMFTHANTLNY